MWARSTLRINVLATLAAILDTPLTKQGNAIPPVINEAHWDYFERIVMNDINNFKGKADAGDLGTGHSAQIKKLEQLVEEYLSKNLSAYKVVTPELQRDGKIPYSYIRQRMTNISYFGPVPISVWELGCNPVACSS